MLRSAGSSQTVTILVARAVGLLIAAIVMAMVLAPAGAWASSYGAATWGANEYGELGVGTSVGPELCFRSASCSRTPVAVAKLSNPIALGSGEDFSCAVISGGKIECWGRNAVGDLGDGTETGPENCPFPSRPEPCSRTPVRVSGITNATTVVGGVAFACALLETHSIDCWGNGEKGELGDGSTESSLTPVPVSGITNAIAIAAGEVDACAVLSNHTVKCWGDGQHGALGNGGTASSSTPVEVSGITTAVAVTAANSYACAVLESGKVTCWGYNESDDLGDGKARKNRNTAMCL
jgi:alpha-tubulin suppressor-like RCC1 family protein